MSITIDICHICLEKKVEFNKLNICNNVDAMDIYVMIVGMIYTKMI